jgi:hypothetical protein
MVGTLTTDFGDSFKFRQGDSIEEFNVAEYFK